MVYVLNARSHGSDGVTPSRVPCGSTWQWLHGSGEQDTVVVAVSDPRSMNWWTQIIGLILGHLLDDAGQNGLKVCVPATAG